ncbi:S100P-binding protein [Ambystoma mexicanum]|uniref:S100P-binding protein n=1 Tax=Ambystoma mexicanum TaxID=8296 RepID=UPI0037E8B098
MKEGNMMIGRSVARQLANSYAASSQSKKRTENFGREVVCKILDGDPAGAAKLIKVRISNENVCKMKRPLDESPSAEQFLCADSKKARLMPFCSSTPCPPEKHSSVDSDCIMGSSGSFEESDVFMEPRQVFFKSKQEYPIVDIDLDDSLLEPSDNEKADSPFHLTEDEISSLLEDNFVATDIEKHAVEVSSLKCSYWHDRNQLPDSSESKLSLSKITVSECGSDSPGEWAESMIILSECGASPFHGSSDKGGCEQERELFEGGFKCSKVVNLPFDFDIDELLALSPIDGSLVERRDILSSDEGEIVLAEENAPLKSKDDCAIRDSKVTAKFEELDTFKGNNDQAAVPSKRILVKSEAKMCQAVASTRPDLDQPKEKTKCLTAVPITSTLEQPLQPPASTEQQSCCGQAIVNKVALHVENPSLLKTSAVSEKSQSSSLITNLVVDPQSSSGKDTSSAEKRSAFLLHLKSMNDPVQFASTQAGNTSGDNGAGSKTVVSKNTGLAVKVVPSPSNTADVKRKQGPSNDSTGELPPVKKLETVLTIPKVKQRQITIPAAELELKKQAYLQCVLKHIRSSGDPKQDAYDELLTLMDQVASVEYRNREQSWQHPSDLTTRNYPRFAKRDPKKYSLKQWMAHNGGVNRRFQNLSDGFQRSAVVLFSSI